MPDSGHQNFAIRRLAGGIASEIHGLDLRNVDQGTMGALRTAFLDRCVLVFNDQFLGPEELMTFSRWWGEIYITPYAPKLEGFPAVLQLNNMGKAKTVTEVWHHDASFQKEPAAIGILAAQVLPDGGGDTMFANQYLAYEALSPALQGMLGGLRAEHKDTVLGRAFGIDTSADPPEPHPVVRTHPETGRRCLYVNTLYTLRFEGMTVEESKPLLDFLTAHSVKPEFVYRHHWRVGDVVMWDQRCTQHYAVHDYGEQERRLYRTTIAGDRPA